MSAMTTSSPGAPNPQGRGNIDSLIPPSWFTRPGDSSVWLRIYTCLFVPMAVLVDAIKEWPGLHDDPHVQETIRIAISFGNVTDFKTLVQSTEIFSESSGRVTIATTVNEKTLPDATYAFMLAPFRIDGAPGNEAATRKRLDEICALLCVHAGRNLLRDCVFEGEVEAKGGRMNVPGPAHKTPQRADGPYLGMRNGTDILEILAALVGAPEPKSSRLHLALRLLDTAMRKKEGFFEYWTALEVVCDGKGGRIKDRFGKIYGLKSQKEAANFSGLGVLSRWRGDYVHKGRPPILTADVERYIQLIFLDLFRHELGLPSRHHAGAMQRARGYDLSPLGLGDSRTEEQRLARKGAFEDSLRDPRHDRT